MFCLASHPKFFLSSFFFFSERKNWDVAKLNDSGDSERNVVHTNSHSTSEKSLVDYFIIFQVSVVLLVKFQNWFYFEMEKCLS